MSPAPRSRTNTSPVELDTLKDLYIHELKDLFSAEQGLVEALAKMAKAVDNQELAGGFQEHFEEILETARRLQQILSSHQATRRRAKCKGMHGIDAVGAEKIKEEVDPNVRDAGLVSAATRRALGNGWVQNGAHLC